MQHLHKREYLNKGDIVEVNCSHQCNILLMDDANYTSYKTGRSFHHYGGFYNMLPARIVVPETGNWNVVLDLGGGTATIRHSIRFIKAP